jgi:hypothetical protein
LPLAQGPRTSADSSPPDLILASPIPRTKIVCTLGPASSSEAVIKSLMQSGLDVARINFSHGTHDEHAATIALVRALATKLNAPRRDPRRSPRARASASAISPSRGARRRRATSCSWPARTRRAGQFPTTYEQPVRSTCGSAIASSSTTASSSSSSLEVTDSRSCARACCTAARMQEPQGHQSPRRGRERAVDHREGLGRRRVRR